MEALGAKDDIEWNSEAEDLSPETGMDADDDDDSERVNIQIWGKRF